MKKLLGIIGLSVALLNGCGDTEEPNPNQNTNQNENNNPSNEETNTDQNQNQNNTPSDENTDTDSNTEPSDENTDIDSNTDPKQEQNNCPNGFGGENCDECLDGHFGENCAPVTCQHGTPAQGITGSGKCTKCDDNYYGENCDSITTCLNGIPNVGISGDGTCSKCDSGFAGPNCDQCAVGFTGLNCDLCDEGFYGETCKAYGQLTDSRDGNQYKTFEFGEQIWMAENLRYAGISHYSAKGNSENDKKYGYLYTWENANKACPSGWRLPTIEEFGSLIGFNEYYDFINIQSIQDKSWLSMATNNTGFSALPAGFMEDGNYGEFGIAGYFWSSSYETEYDGLLLYVYLEQAMLDRLSRESAFSVRCLKESN